MEQPELQLHFGVSVSPVWRLLLTKGRSSRARLCEARLCAVRFRSALAVRKHRRPRLSCVPGDQAGEEAGKGQVIKVIRRGET